MLPDVEQERGRQLKQVDLIAPSATPAAIAAYLSRRDHEQALLACARGLQRDPHSIDLWLLKAQAHMGAEQWGLAEIALRTANAYGAPPASVSGHLETALIRQGTSLTSLPLNPCNREPGPDQSPGAPDVSALAKLAWHADEVANTDMLTILRTCRSMDHVLAAMIDDARFARVNLPWLAVIREDEF